MSAGCRLWACIVGAARPLQSVPAKRLAGNLPGDSGMHRGPEANDRAWPLSGHQSAPPRTSPSTRVFCRQCGACPPGRWRVQTPVPHHPSPGTESLRSQCLVVPAQLTCPRGWAGPVTSLWAYPAFGGPHTLLLQVPTGPARSTRTEGAAEGRAEGLARGRWPAVTRAQLPNAFDVRISGRGRGGKDTGPGSPSHA